MVSLLTYISEIIHTKDTFDHKLWRLERDLGPTHSAPQFWEDAREDDIMCILVLGTTADYMLTRYFFLTLLRSGREPCYCHSRRTLYILVP